MLQVRRVVPDRWAELSRSLQQRCPADHSSTLRRAEHAASLALIRNDERKDTIRESLGAARSRGGDGGHAGRPVHRPAPGARGHLTAGVRAAAVAGLAVRRPIARSRRWITRRPPIQQKCSAACRSKSNPPRARSKSSKRTAASSASSCSASAAISAASCMSSVPSSARRSPVRRSSAATATRHARRIRRPRFRHRHDRSRSRARDAVLVAAKAEDARDRSHRPTGRGVTAKDLDPRDHRQDRRIRRHGARHRVPRQRRSKRCRWMSA